MTLVLACAALPGAAQAQTAEQQQTATARLLFKTGVEQGDAGDWEAAVESFRRALALRESMVIRFNLAQALQHVGRLLEASEHFRAVETDPSADDALVGQAHSALSEIEPLLATLTVSVEGAPEDSEVKLDGTVLLPVQLGVPVPADPGDHEATLSANGEVLVKRSVTLAEGGSGSVELTYVPTPAEAAATMVEEPAEPPLEEGMGRRKKRWIIGVSAAVAVVAAAVIVGVTAGGGGGGSGVSGFDPPSITVMGQ